MSATEQITNTKNRKAMRGKGKKKKNYLSKKTYKGVMNIINKMNSKQVEYKHYSRSITDIDTNPIGSNSSFFTAQTYDICSMPQGTSDTQRIGDQIKLKAIDIRGGLTHGSQVNTILRLTIYQYNSDQPPNASVLYETTSPGKPQMFCPIRKDSQKLVNVLRDQLFFVDNSENKQDLFKFYINKGFRKNIEYFGGTTTGNSKIFITINSWIDIALNAPQHSFYSTITYSDS